MPTARETLAIDWQQRPDPMVQKEQKAWDALLHAFMDCEAEQNKTFDLEFETEKNARIAALRAKLELEQEANATELDAKRRDLDQKRVNRQGAIAFVLLCAFSILVFWYSTKRTGSGATSKVPRHQTGETSDKGLQAVSKDIAPASELTAPDRSVLDAYLLSAKSKMAHMDFDGAIQDLDSANEFLPASADLYMLRGALNYCKGQYDAALKDYDKAVVLNPAFADAYSGRAHVRFAKAEIDAALKDFDRALELDPENAEAYRGRGEARLKQKEYLQQSRTLTRH